MDKQTFVTDIDDMDAKQKCLHYFIAFLYVYHRIDLSNYCGPFPSSANPCVKTTNGSLYTRA